MSEPLTYVDALRILRRDRNARVVLCAGAYWLHPGGRVDTADARRLIKRLAVVDIGLFTGIPQSWRYEPPTPIRLHRRREGAADTSLQGRASAPRQCRGPSERAVQSDNEAKSMDTTTFLKGNIITAKGMKEAGEEVIEGLVIADCVNGKFGRPELVFESKDRFSLNDTNLRKMHKHYGTESNAWSGVEIKLVLGEATYEDEQVDSVLLVPVSPDITKEKRRAAKKAADDADPFYGSDR